MPFQITGKIEVIGATASITSKDGSKTYHKRELVLDCTRYNPNTGEPWENYPKFELSGNNCAILDQFQVGQRVTVDFSLRGVKYTDQTTGEIKYFTGVCAFKVQLAQQTYQNQPATALSNQQPQTMSSGAVPFPPQIDNNGMPIENKDDLPF